MPDAAVSGRMRSSGCCRPVVKVCLGYKYAVGSVVYDRRKAAREGLVDAVAVKSVKFISADKVLYTDTTNWLYNEADLCHRHEAVALAATYYERLIQAIDHKISIARCP